MSSFCIRLSPTSDTWRASRRPVERTAVEFHIYKVKLLFFPFFILQHQLSSVFSSFSSFPRISKILVLPKIFIFCHQTSLKVFYVLFVRCVRRISPFKLFLLWVCSFLSTFQVDFLICFGIIELGIPLFALLEHFATLFGSSFDFSD